MKPDASEKKFLSKIESKDSLFLFFLSIAAKIASARKTHADGINILIRSDRNSVYGKYAAFGTRIANTIAE
ncbi:MAG: hypothetical protein K5838_02290 [Elusimicrobiales bacterium]|nr:hypothetical protein [Elusimicrobiales bacterium]